MCGSMVDIQSAAAEIRRGKKNKRQTTGQKYNGMPYYAIITQYIQWHRSEFGECLNVWRSNNRSAVEASKREGVEGMYVSCKGMGSPWEIFTARRNASAVCDVCLYASLTLV